MRVCRDKGLEQITGFFDVEMLSVMAVEPPLFTKKGH